MKNPKLGQIQLGHKNIKTTLTHYTGPNEKDKERIDDILAPRREVDPEEIAEDLSRRYINEEIPEQEYLYAIKSLRQANNTSQHDKDPAFQ